MTEENVNVILNEAKRNEESLKTIKNGFRFFVVSPYGELLRMTEKSRIVF